MILRKTQQVWKRRVSIRGGKPIKGTVGTETETVRTTTWWFLYFIPVVKVETVLSTTI